MLRCEDLESRQLLNADMGWVKPFGDSGFDAVYEVAVDADDNVYSVARFAGSVDLDPDASYQDDRDLVSVPITAYGVVVTKFDPEGNLLWSHVAEGQDGSLPGVQSSTPKDIQVQDGSVFVYGSLNDVWDFDPTNPDTESQLDHFGNGNGSYLLRLDASTGGFQWVTGFGLSAAAPTRNDSLAVAPDGSSYLSIILREGAQLGEEIVPSQPLDDSVGIVRVSNGGQVLGYDELVSHDVDAPALEMMTPTTDPASWRLYFSTGFRGDLSLNGTTIATNSSDNIDVYFASLTLDNTVENGVQYEYPLNQYANYLSAGESGLYIAGDLNIDASDNSGSSLVGDDFLFRVDTNGNLLATQAFGDELSSAIIYSVNSAADGVLIAGSLRDHLRLWRRNPYLDRRHHRWICSKARYSTSCNKCTSLQWNGNRYCTRRSSPIRCNGRDRWLVRRVSHNSCCWGSYQRWK